LAASSVFVGTLGALFQKKLKRLLAFSSISHGGFVLLAIACFSLESSKAISFYLVIYIVTSFALFSLIALAISKSGLLKYLVN
jgi:NADH:ubiquinone oxidoreductase subunit 2 (subunit N)